MLDAGKLLLPAAPKVYLVESVADYAAACLAVRNALHAGSKTQLEVRVHHRTVGAWLRQWAGAYPDQIQVRTYTALDALQERWGIEIPRQYEQEILRSGLLEAQVTPREGQSFENVVLEYFYHDFFAYPTFPPEHFARLLNQVDPARWEANAKRPLVTLIFRQRLEQWRQKENNTARQALIERCMRDVIGLRQAFAAYKVLRGYPPELAKKILGEDAEIFRRAQVDPEPLTLQDVALEHVVTEIEYYLNGQLKTLADVQAFLALLDQMSGHLLAEFNFVDSFLRNHADWLTVEVVRKVEHRFAPLRNGLGSRLNKLRTLVVVNPPPAPSAAWTASEWLDWTAHLYMPHHRWLELQHRYDEQTAGYAAAFADWYYENFTDLKYGQPEHFAFSAIYNDHQTFTDGNAIALVLLLDNFNYAFFPELRRLFARQNVSLAAERPVFALPPAATEVGKASLIAVTGDLTDIETKDYGKLVTQIWGKLLAPRGKSAGYLATIGELQNLAELKHDLYFLNYLPVDEALHESSQKIGMEHGTRVHDLLEKLVESVVEFGHRFQIEKCLNVYVISDHGSTRIGREVVNVLDKKYYKGLADLQHHRYLTLSDEQVVDLPQAVSVQCYVIDRQKFKTHANYLAARRYYRFIETSEDFYVHGGLTPEEIVVPFARFVFQPLSVQTPTVRLLKNQYRYAIKSVIEFEIGNPNSFALDNIRLQLRGVEAEEVLIETLPGKHSTQVAFQTVFRKEPRRSDNRDLILSIQYEYQERLSEPVEVPVTISLKGVMETRDDFDF